MNTKYFCKKKKLNEWNMIKIGSTKVDIGGKNKTKETVCSKYPWRVCGIFNIRHDLVENTIKGYIIFWILSM